MRLYGALPSVLTISICGAVEKHFRTERVHFYTLLIPEYHASWGASFNLSRRKLPAIERCVTSFYQGGYPRTAKAIIPGGLATTKRF